MAAESFPDYSLHTLTTIQIKEKTGWRLTIDNLGQVDFTQAERPLPEEIEGAKLGLLHNLGRLSYEQAVRTAAEIDNDWKRKQPKKRGLPTPSVITPATTVLARVIGGIPPDSQS